jgi:hypothetical protein
LENFGKVDPLIVVCEIFPTKGSSDRILIHQDQFIAVHMKEEAVLQPLFFLLGVVWI